MRYFAHIEVEIEADTFDEASEIADEVAGDVKDQFVFTVIDSFVVNVE
jgi:hypothetical protein